MKKSRKRYYIEKLHKLIGLSILLLMAAIVIANIVKKDGEMSEKENRMLEQRPNITLDDIADGRFMQKYESYQSDQFIFRDFWVSLKARMDLLMGKNYSNGVYKGKSHYLIEEAAAPDTENMAANVAAMNALADSGTVNVFAMIVPNAVNILSDKLPAFSPVRNQAEDLEGLKASLSANIKYIDVTEALKSHKEDEQLYYRNDHHWTTLGAYYAFLEAAETLGLDTSAITYDRYMVSENFTGTLAATSGYGAGKKDTVEIFTPSNSNVEYVVEYVNEKQKKASVYSSEMLEKSDKYAVFFGGNFPLIKINTTNAGGKRLLIVKDSYANCFIPFLIPYYREIVIVDPRYYYDNVKQEISDSLITDVLFLYNANTFFEDNSLSHIFED